MCAGWTGSRELLARVWATGGGADDGLLTIDLDSTFCEIYGLAKERVRRHNYTGQRSYHSFLPIAAGTGDVLVARLRQGRANMAWGAAYFLRETISRVRYAGAIGQFNVRADGGFYTHAVVAVCRKMDVRSTTICAANGGFKMRSRCNCATNNCVRLQLSVHGSHGLAARMSKRMTLITPFRRIIL